VRSAAPTEMEGSALHLGQAGRGSTHDVQPFLGLSLPDAALAEGTPNDVRQLIAENRGRTDPAERVVQ
jgi:hypothetical protein